MPFPYIGLKRAFHFGILPRVLPWFGCAEKVLPLRLILWMSSGTESTVGLPPRRDNHTPTTGIGNPESHCHFNANKAQTGNLSYVAVIHFLFIYSELAVYPLRTL